jgi:hypothetical protein
MCAPALIEKMMPPSTPRQLEMIDLAEVQVNNILHYLHSQKIQVEGINVDAEGKRCTFVFRAIVKGPDGLDASGDLSHPPSQ